MTFASGAASDTGLLRERNEDRYWTDPARGVYLVVDGVGGQAAGEVAAQLAVDTIRDTIFCDAPDEDRVRGAIAAANNRIWELAQSQPSLCGMACVLTLALVDGERVTIGHVGDSRLYLIWHGAIRKLTTDHSPVGEGEDAGEISELEAMHHPRRNEVYREVGSARRRPDELDFIEVRHCRLRSDTAMLLCSDGLTDLLTSDEVREIAERYAGDAGAVARELVTAANDAGGRDNVTALFVAGPEFPGAGNITRPRLIATRPQRGRARLLGSRVAFLAYGLLLGMLIWATLRARGVMP
jgi:serine/threonine protein phosphatase PrpC